MKDFKFFQKGTLDDSQMLDETTRATASFNDDAPSGWIRIRHYADRDIYDRPTLNNDDIIVKGDGTDNQIKLHQATRVTTVNPNWWMKIKLVLISSWLTDSIGIVVVCSLSTIITIIGIAKMLGAW